MTNPIFQEIEEDLERQRMEAIWKRYGGWIIAGAVLIVLATASYTAYSSWRTRENQKATTGLINIVSNEFATGDKQIQALQDFAQKNHGLTQATFAQLQAAAMAVKAGDNAKAIQIYDAIAADSSTDAAFRQLADLFAVQVQMDSGDPVSLQKRLQPLLADNAPWRYTAMEDDAFLALRAGDKAKAKQLFTELSQDASAPQGIGQRAADMVRFIDE